MAKESVTVFEMANVMNSTTATDVAEKRYTSLNGYDAALRKDAKILLFSASMKEETRTRGANKFKSQFFWGIDIERNKLVKVSRTGLAGGMGYQQLPMPGVWGFNEERTWHILKPQEGDPAIQSRKSWGISRLLPGAFEYEKQQVSIPRCFIIEVTKIEYLCSRSPIDASASETFKAKELSDCTFKEDAARMWDGTAYYPTREKVSEIITAYNAVHTDKLTDEMIAELLK